MRLCHFPVDERREHGEHIRLYQRVQERKQHADDDGKHKGERKVVVDEFGHEHAAQQRAKQTEAHGNGQRELLEGTKQSPALVRADAADEDEGVAEAPQRNRAVDVRKRCRQRNARPVCRLPRDADQLKQRSEKDIDARREDIRAQRVVAVRTVASCHAVEESDRLLQNELELPRNALELRNDEDAHDGGEKQNGSRHEIRRNESGIDGQPEQTDPVPFVQNGVLHGLLNTRLPLVQPVRQNDADNEQHDDRRNNAPEDDLLFFAHGFLLRQVPRPHFAAYHYTLLSCARQSSFTRHTMKKTDEFHPLPVFCIKFLTIVTRLSQFAAVRARQGRSLPLFRTGKGRLPHDLARRPLPGDLIFRRRSPHTASENKRSDTKHHAG